MATEVIELLPVSVNLKVYRGDSIEGLTFIYKTGGIAVNLTGYTFLAQVKAKQDDTTALLTFSVSIPTPANGTFILSLTGAQTATLPAKVLYWDVQTIVAGVTRTLAGGKFTVSKDVSRV